MVCEVTTRNSLANVPSSETYIDWNDNDDDDELHTCISITHGCEYKFPAIKVFSVEFN